MAEAEPTTIARPYARAAFSYALDQTDGLSIWSRMLNTLGIALAHPTVEEALDSPLLTIEDETALLVQLMADELNSDGKNFIGVLAEYGRLALLPTISEMFELLKANHEKTMEVEVVSAFEVSEQQKSELGSALQRLLQRDIDLETSVDKTLIGGVVIKAEDMVIDDSVRGKLEKLSQALN